MKKYILYILGVLLASSFHYSALFLLFLPFIDVTNYSNKSLILLYLVIFVAILFGIDKLFIDKILSRIPILHSRFSFYENSNLTEGNIFSVGLILRLICLWGMLYFRNRIYKEKKQFLFNLCYIYLLLSLLSYSIPILFRMPFFLSPFFVLMVSEFVDYLKPKTRRQMKCFYLWVAITITIKTTTSVYYVPYTNVITYWVEGKTLDYGKRSVYNFNNSPYR